MPNQNIVSLFTNPKFTRRLLEWAVTAIGVVGTLAVVAHAFVTGADALDRAQLVLEGCEIIVTTLIAAVAAGALHTLATDLEADLDVGGPRYAPA